MPHSQQGVEERKKQQITYCPNFPSSQAYGIKRNGGSGENGERNTRVKPLRMRNISIFKIAASQQERLFFLAKIELY